MGGQTEWTGQSFSGHRLQGCIEGSIKGTESSDSLVLKMSWQTASSPLIMPTKQTISKPRAVAGKDLSCLDSNPSERNEGEVAIEKPQKDSNAGSDVQFSTKPTEKKRKRVRRLGDEFDRITTKRGSPSGGHHPQPSPQYIVIPPLVGQRGALIHGRSELQSPSPQGLR
ncbi:hypothetical protein ZIOFF_026753 [Zingiber officinale]|uniref:Uncharacterized protein n=1 Tax=Zingiber officinale TaxID=94328 RepID=A0A8J5H4F6_ZINOF|nr:hypothetical protein ZIOFF_026753 [Zingiber officinale]